METIAEITNGAVMQMGLTISPFSSVSNSSTSLTNTPTPSEIIPLVTNSAGQLNRWSFTAMSTAARAMGEDWNPLAGSGATFPLGSFERLQISRAGNTFNAYSVGYNGFFYFDIEDVGVNQSGNDVLLSSVIGSWVSNWTFSRTLTDLEVNAGVSFNNACVNLPGLDNNSGNNTLLSIDPNDNNKLVLIPTGTQGIAGITVQDGGTVEGIQAGVTTINFGSNLNVTPSNNEVLVEAVDTGINGITVAEEGNTVGTSSGVTTLNFRGTGATATGSGSEVTIDISAGGSGSSLSIEDSGTEVNASPSTLNFNTGLIAVDNSQDATGTTDVNLSMDVISVDFTNANSSFTTGTRFDANGTGPDSGNVNGFGFWNDNVHLLNDQYLSSGETAGTTPIILPSPFISLYSGTTEQTGTSSEISIRNSGTAQDDSFDLGLQSLRFDNSFSINQTLADSADTNSGITGDYTIQLDSSVPKKVQFQIITNPDTTTQGAPEQIVQQIDNTGTVVVNTSPGTVDDGTNVWTINHDLGTLFPIVQVYDNVAVPNMNMILPDEITVVNNNTIQITFASTADINGFAVITG